MSATQVSRRVFVYGVGEVCDLIGIKFPHEQRFAKPPPPQNGLVFFDPGLSIVEVLHRMKMNFYLVPNVMPFAYESTRARYRTLDVSKPRHECRTFRDQANTLSSNERAGSARTVILGTIIHTAITGRPPFEGLWIRCAEPYGNNRRMAVKATRGDDYDVHLAAIDDSRARGDILLAIEME